LLILIKDPEFSNDVNNIKFLDTMRKFFIYTCRSPFAQLYQCAAGKGSPETAQKLFLSLPENIKKTIYNKVWMEADRPYIRDPQWEATHVFDNMQRFYGALREYARESLENFNKSDRTEKERVHQNVHRLAQLNKEKETPTQDPSLSHWGEIHVLDDMLRLIDALHCSPTDLKPTPTPKKPRLR
jgi:hypothetical protein